MKKNDIYKNILIIAPHSDDELFVLDFLYSIKCNFNKISLLILDNNPERKIESANLCNQLGIILIHNNDHDIDFKDGSFHENFRALNLYLLKTIKEYSLVLSPLLEGGHQDHDVSNFICSKFKRYCKVFEFPEYNYFNNKINCNTFIKKDDDLTILNLTEEEKEFKKNCLKIYKSEKKNLNYININVESFRPLKNYDYSKPAHTGVLFYRRFSLFSWHPRVDGDKPEYVCKKITESKIFK